MLRRILKFIIFFILVSATTTCNMKQETITISGAFGLYPMAVKWAEEYKKINPLIRLDISAGGAGKGMADVLYENVDLGMLSRDINPREETKGAYPISVVKDAVIPTFNSNNPNKEVILSQGISKEIFTDIFIYEKYKMWGAVLHNSSQAPLHVYTRSDASGAPETWAKYLGKKQEDLKGVGVFGDPGLADAVKNDINAIGFNNVVYIYDAKSKLPHKNLLAVPIDINGNGRIDSIENFYKTLPEIVQAIAHDLYPSPPARELYFVTKDKPKRKAVIEFLSWVLTKGQAYVNESGYINLSTSILAEQKKKISAQ